MISPLSILILMQLICIGRASFEIIDDEELQVFPNDDDVKWRWSDRVLRAGGVFHLTTETYDAQIENNKEDPKDWLILFIRDRFAES